MSHLPSLLVLTPLIGAGLLLLLGGGRTLAAQRTAAGVTLVTLGIALAMMFTIDPATTHADAGGGFLPIPPLSWVDGLNLWLLLLTALLSLTAVLMTPPYGPARLDRYLATVLVLEASLLGLFAAGHLVWLFLCWEVSRLSLFFLTGVWGGPERRAAATKFFLFTLVGSGFLFAAAGLLVWSHYQLSGGEEFTLNLAQLIDEIPQLAASEESLRQFWSGTQPWILAALLLGLAIQVPVFPLHTWLQGMAVESPTAGMLLLCGAWLKVGAYGCVRLALPLFPEHAADYAGYLLWPALIGTVYGAMLALVQDDLKRLAANVTVGYAAFAILGLFSGTAVGVQGGFLLLCSHGLAMGILIAVVGALIDRYRTGEMEAFSGLAGRFPKLTTLALLGIGALAGVPFTSGFWATIWILFGVYEVSPGFVVTLLIAGLLCVTCLVRVSIRVFSGPFREPVIEHPAWAAQHQDANEIQGDLKGRELLALLPLATVIVCLGVAPSLFLDKTEPAVTRLIDRGDPVETVDRGEPVP